MKNYRASILIVFYSFSRNNPHLHFLIILLFYTVLKQKIMWCIHIFSKGFFASLIYKDKTVKSLKPDPSKLKLTASGKTGPDITIYEFRWIFIFPVPTFRSLFKCVYCVFVSDDESGSQRLSLRETSSPCVGQHSEENKQIPSFAPSLFLLSSTVHLLCNVGVHFTIFWRPCQVFSFY